MARSFQRNALMFAVATITAMAASLAIIVSLQDRSPTCRALSLDAATGAPRLEWGLILTKDQEIDCLRQVAAQVGREGLTTWLQANGFRAAGAGVAVGRTVISAFYPNRLYRRPKSPTWHWFLSHGQSINFTYFDSALAPRITSHPIFL
jgi:hypothetical protein